MLTVSESISERRERWRLDRPFYMLPQFLPQYRMIVAAIDDITSKEPDGSPWNEETSRDFEHATFEKIAFALRGKIGRTTLRTRLKELSLDGVLDGDGGPGDPHKKVRDWLVQWPEKLDQLKS